MNVGHSLGREVHREGVQGEEVQGERDRKLWDTPLIPALHGDKTMKYSISVQNQASVGMLTIIKNGLGAPTSLT